MKPVPELHKELEWQCQGELFLLLAERAILHPATGILAIADLHLGKASHFQNQGLAVPDDDGEYDLQRLSNLLDPVRVSELWILGDICHQPRSLNPATIAAWNNFTHRHPGILIQPLTGNHDRCLPQAFGALDGHAATLARSRLLGSHEPLIDVPPGMVNLCGHLHPVFRYSRNGLVLRKPAFLLRTNCIILPAFGTFTGGYQVEKLARGEHAALIIDDSILLV